MPSCANFHRLADTRARELPSRLVYGFVVGCAVWATTHNLLWPFVWYAAVCATQLLDHRMAAPIRRDPACEPSRTMQAAYLASFALNTAVFSSIAPYCWLHGGLEGCIFAVFVPAGGLLNVALQVQSARRIMWAGCTPHLLIMFSLPLSSLLLGEASNRVGMTFVVIGAFLYFMHLVVAGRRNEASSTELAEALSVAQAERLRAEQASATKSEFLATMSHEIRTPLNGVLGMVQVMAANELPPAQKQRLEIVRQSGEVLLTLLNDLLDVSKIEAAKLELEDGVVEMPTLASQAEATFGPLASDKQILLRIRLLDSARQARRGDPMRVRQVLYNLIANAVKFTEEGRVTVMISGTEDELVIEMADSGPGIPPDRLATLFERFTQADASITRRHGGSGLGLAISRGLARLMGGDITATSQIGEGSVFTARFNLPRTEAAPAARPLTPVAVRAPAAEPPAAPPEPVPESPMSAEASPAAEAAVRILAVEDNPTNRLVLQTLLQQVGIEPHLVENGEEAVKAWRAAHWDLILMDIQMPVMDGIAATREIRAAEAREGRARTPIIALTANAMAHQAAEYTAVGMDALVPKPIQFENLLSTMGAMLEDPAQDDGALAASA